VNNTTLLVSIDRFDPNPIMVNVNKLKPYRIPKATNPFEILLKTIYPIK
jgi:hypothetical protein